MYEQTSAGRDREMDVGGTTYETTTVSSTTAVDPVGTTGTTTGTTGYEAGYESGYESGEPGSGAPGAKDKAASAAKAGAQAASDSAKDVAQTAKEQARNVAGEASAQARRMASDVRSQVTDKARQQHGTMVSRLRQASDEMREMANSRDQSPASNLVGNLAERTNRFADHLESRGPEGVLSDVQEFARRKPGTFLLAAAAAGFVVGRVGKSVFTAPNNPLSGGDSGDQGYRSAYEAGTADTFAGFREGGTGYAGTTGYADTDESFGTTATPVSSSTTYTTRSEETDLIRDEGDWNDPKPDAVAPQSGSSGITSEGGRS